MFDYVSSIISYSLVGVAIFSGQYDNSTPAQLASAVSEVRANLIPTLCDLFITSSPLLCVHSVQNTFFSMYLLNSFSTVVDTAVKFAEIAGYTHRCMHMKTKY